MKKNGFLLLIIIGLAFIAIQKPEFNSKPIYKKISAIDINTIQHITITSTDQKPIQFTKRENSWYIINNDKEDKVSKGKIAYLLSLPNTNSLESFSVPQSQLKQYRLSHPNLTVQFDKLKISFGNSEPIKHRRYILIDSKVHLIQSLYYHLLLQPTDSYFEIDNQ